MRKVLLDLRLASTPELIQEYLAFKLDFPDYYGGNLDALYDCLTEICEDTCVGFFEQENHPQTEYLKKVRKVMKDAEQDNPHLCVVFSELEENYTDDEVLAE